MGERKDAPASAAAGDPRQRVAACEVRLGTLRRGTPAALAVLIATGFLLLTLAPSAEAGKRKISYKPVDRTARALVFRIEGVEARRIKGAVARLRAPNRKLHRRLSVRRVRRAVNRGRKLRVRRPSGVRRGVVVVKLRSGGSGEGADVVAPDPPSAGAVDLGEAPDTTPPETTITSGPNGIITTDSASFSFTSSEAGSSFECRFDSGSWSACASPKAYSSLAEGSHAFEVTVTDAAGNVDPTPASRTFEVILTSATYTVPPSVPAGCSSDATSQILSWIDSVPDDSTLSFGTGACYRIEGTLEFRDRELALDGNGSTFRPFNPPSGQRAMWRAWNSTISFREMTLVGSYANGGTLTDSLQWAHGIDLRGTHGVVDDVSISDLAGDCVYFGLGASRSSGAVYDSSCRRIGRNAVSVVAGNDIRVERMITNRIGYIAFDVEPNTGPGNGAARVSFDSNAIGSYQMKAYTVIGNAPVSDVDFTNNRMVGQGLRIGVVNKSHRPRRLTINGNSSDTATAHNAMNLQSVDDLTIRRNTVPLTSGTMAQVAYSCGVDVSGNSYPGGSREASIIDPSC
jgi:hypothetical protein